MDIRDLEEFLFVLKAGSILRAAEDMEVAQPALNRRMRALENELGVPLLNRNSTCVVPTAHGEILERHARQLLHGRDLAIDELRSLTSGSVGHARLGVAPTLSSLLPIAIDRLCRARPGLSYSVFEGTYDSLIADLRAGKVDGVFSLLAPRSRPEDVVVRKLNDDELSVFCHPAHKLRRRRKLRLADLADQRWVILSEPHSRVDDFASITSRFGLKNPKISVRTDSLDTLKSLVAGGNLIALLPMGAMRAELADKRIDIVNLQDRLPKVKAALCIAMKSCRLPSRCS